MICLHRYREKNKLIGEIALIGRIHCLDYFPTVFNREAPIFGEMLFSKNVVVIELPFNYESSEITLHCADKCLVISASRGHGISKDVPLANWRGISGNIKNDIIRIFLVVPKSNFNSVFYGPRWTASHILKLNYYLSICFDKIRLFKKYVGTKLCARRFLCVLERPLGNFGTSRGITGLAPQKTNRTSGSDGPGPAAKGTQPSLYRAIFSEAPSRAYQESKTYASYCDKSDPGERIASNSDYPHACPHSPRFSNTWAFALARPA